MNSKERGIPFNRLPVIGAVFRGYDRKIGEEGLHRATDWLITRSGGRVEGFADDETRAVLTGEPVLLIANHTWGAEAFPLIAALPPRKDVFVISGLDYTTLGSNLTPHLIPVFSTEPTKKEDERLLAKLRKVLKIGPMLTLTPREAGERNVSAIKKACEIVNGGGMVIICPSGARKDEASWYTGIGHMIKGVGGESGAYLIYAYISGTSSLDPLRFFPGIGKYLPTFRVFLSRPRKASEIFSGETRPVGLTKTLQDEYTKWVRQIRY
ncbi:MAG TPA: hypothetical protein VJ227_02165 [Patescibacteria group bacterium]|nr:hypothetical protein [Patescibacteria group bacterium]